MVQIDPNFCRLILVVAEAKAGQKKSDKRALILILVAGGLIFVATSNANSITSFFCQEKILLLEKLAPDMYSIFISCHIYD